MSSMLSRWDRKVNQCYLQLQHLLLGQTSQLSRWKHNAPSVKGLTLPPCAPLSQIPSSARTSYGRIRTPQGFQNTIVTTAAVNTIQAFAPRVTPQLTYLLLQSTLFPQLPLHTRFNFNQLVNTLWPQSNRSLLEYILQPSFNNPLLIFNLLFDVLVYTFPPTTIMFAFSRQL